MPIAAAIPAIIGGVGSIAGGLLGSHAANQAGNIQQQNAYNVAGMVGDATKGAIAGEGDAVIGANGQILNGQTNANSTLAGIYGQQQQNLNPYLQAGQQGLSSLSAAFAPGGSLTDQFHAPTAEEAEATPGYQFQMAEGLKALQRSAAAQGSLQGGGTLKALTQYGQGLASTNYQNTYNNAFNTFQTNHQNTLQGLMALTGVGQNANAQFNSAAQNYGNQAANNLMQGGELAGQNMLRSAEYQGNTGLRGYEAVGNILTGGANAKSASVVGAGNAWERAIGGVTNSAQSYANQQYYGGGQGGGQTPGFTPYDQGRQFNPYGGQPPAVQYNAGVIPAGYAGQPVNPYAPRPNQSF